MDDARQRDDESRRPNRRTFLKGVGAAAVGVAATGTASAHQYKFYGCSRVCSDTDGDLAVVATADGFECRAMTSESKGHDVPWDWGAHCYRAAADEVVVGAIEEAAWQGERYIPSWSCQLVFNPNSCAEGHYESAKQVRFALGESDRCGACGDHLVLADEPDVTATSVENGTGPNHGANASEAKGDRSNGDGPNGDGSNDDRSTGRTVDLPPALAERLRWLDQLVSIWR